MNEEGLGAGMQVPDNVQEEQLDDLSETTNSNDSIHYPSQDPPPTPIQKETIEKIYNNKLENGKAYYILCSKWWRQWKRYVGFQNEKQDPQNPGVITNDHLFSNIETRSLMKGISEGSDFEFIQEEIWNLLKDWYGYDYEIKRIASTDSRKNVRIQLNPVNLRVVKSSDENEVHEVKVFTMLCTVKDFIRLMCKKMDLKVEDVRLWDFYGRRKLELLSDSSFMSECNLMENQLLLLEERGENGEFPPARTYNDRIIHRAPSDPGKTGLDNLGNTCFMNSAIQCLSSVAPLTDFFVTDEYKGDINLKNPLGMQGQIANAYANLLKELWSPLTSVVAPRDFKRVIEKYAPQFSGYQQHDSQELVAFLLDGLHEDLNRVQDKPYIEEDDELDIPLEEKAKIAWDNYLLRNRSIIVDYFQGLLKSRLVCPTCSKVSIKFDPFMYLTLPLPVETKRKLIVTVHFLDTNRKPTKYCVKVEKAGSVKDLINALSEVTGIPSNRMKIYESFKHKFHKKWKENEWIAEIADTDVLYAFEIPEDEEYIQIKVLNGKKDKYKPSQISLYGEPFILNIKRTITPREAYKVILDKVKYFLTDTDIPELVQLESTSQNAEKDSDDDESSDEEQVNVETNAISVFYVVNRRENVIDLFKQPIDTEIELERHSRYYLTFGEEEYSKYIEDDEDRWFDEDESIEKIYKEKEIRKTSIDLKESLDMFTVEEILSADDTWYCNRCKEHKQATKKFDLWRLPKILVIHLKRFSYKNKYSKDKIKMLVDFPLKDLDLSEFVKGEGAEDSMYDLVAVSNHYGDLGGGHYTAYAYHRNENKWYDYNDSSVREVSEKDICTPSAYLLFYKRKDVPWSTFEYQIPEPEPEIEPIDDALIHEA